MISLFRKYQYKKLSELSLDGKIIDLGGSRKSGYHQLIKGIHDFTVVNIDKNYGFDLNFNLEEKFPLNDNSYDHVLGISVLEHIFNYDNFLSESHRIVKEGGKIVLILPFMFHIHGCPYDYNRFTKDAIIKICKNNGFQIESIETLGEGVFSVTYQMIFGLIPLNLLKKIVQNVAVLSDNVLKKISKKYQKISPDYPLGYFIILTKKENHFKNMPQVVKRKSSCIIENIPQAIAIRESHIVENTKKVSYKKYYKEAVIFKNKCDFIDEVFKLTDNVLDVGFFGQGIKMGNKFWGHELIKNKVNYLLGIDLNKEILHLDKQQYNYELKNAEEFDYNHKFNVIYAGDLIEHVSNPGKFLESCRKSLTKGGTIIISTPNTFNLFNIIEKLVKLEPAINHDHIAYYNIKSFYALVSRYGLHLEKIAFIYSLEVDYKKNMFKIVQDIIYLIVSKFTNKYLETIVFFVKESNTE